MKELDISDDEPSLSDEEDEIDAEEPEAEMDISRDPLRYDAQD